MDENTPELQEFDMILVRKAGSILKAPLGNIIEWIQWGLGVKSPEFIHVATVIKIHNELVLFDTNPPASRFSPLSSVDWKISSVFRLNQIDFPLDEAQKKTARMWCLLQTGKSYDYLSILWFAILGLYGYLGMYFRKDVRRILSKENKMKMKKANVCSQLIDVFYNKILCIDILPEIGAENAVPGDLSGSIAHKHIYGKLGK